MTKTLTGTVTIGSREEVGYSRCAGDDAASTAGCNNFFTRIENVSGKRRLVVFVQHVTRQPIVPVQVVFAKGSYEVPNADCGDSQMTDDELRKCGVGIAYMLEEKIYGAIYPAADAAPDRPVNNVSPKPHL